MNASVVMDRIAGLLNDTAKQVYTYAVQVPYVNIAIDELQEMMELNNINATNEVSSVIQINVGVTNIGGSGPALPTDLVEIRGLYERQTGTTNSFDLMDRCVYLPTLDILTSALIYWAWQDQIIQFIGANQARDVKINYIGATLPNIVDETSVITLINAKSFLSFRGAALCAEFVGENTTRSTDLNTMAQLAIDRFLGINVKGGQQKGVRRRPFLSRFKRRCY